MNKIINLGALFFITSTVVLADGFTMDFHWKFKENAAQQLFNTKKYKEAEQAFEALIPTAATEEDKNKTLSKAAIALGCQKDQFETAMEKAQAIGDKVLSTYTQFRILDFNLKYQALTETFKDEDISAWPDSIKPEGYSMRGRAYSVLENYEAAILDYQAFIKISGLLNSKNRSDVAYAYNSIASFQLKLDQKDSAIETYEAALAYYEKNKEIIGQAPYCRAVTAYGELLKQDKKYEKAIKVLTRHKAESPSAAAEVFVLAGDLYVLMDEKDKAIEKYKEAIEATKLRKKDYGHLTKKIEMLQKN